MPTMPTSAEAAKRRAKSPLRVKMAAVAVLMLRGEADCILECGSAQDLKYRAKDFLVIPPHLRGHVVEQRGSKEIAALKREAPAIDEHRLERAAEHPFAWCIDDMLECPSTLSARDRSGCAAGIPFPLHCRATGGCSGGAGVGHIACLCSGSGRAAGLRPARKGGDHWLVMHADQQKLPRIRAIVDF
jgi:hypothetical protein